MTPLARISRTHHNPWRRLSAACLLWFFTTHSFAASGEYELKAAFIGRFVEFIDWPTPPTDDPQATVPFLFCVYGASPIEEPMGKLPTLLKSARATFEYRRVESAQAASDCAVLFVPASATTKLSDIRQYSAGKGVLTVGDSASARSNGVIINFFFQEDRLRFSIDLTAARTSGFTISSRLLKLAEVVE